MSKSIEEREAWRLIYEIRESGENIRTGKALSRYIMSNNVAARYPHIAGHLEMQSNDGCDSWTFKNGIDPQWYAFVCRHLSASSRGGDSHPVGFTAYNDL